MNDTEKVQLKRKCIYGFSRLLSDKRIKLSLEKHKFERDKPKVGSDNLNRVLNYYRKLERSNKKIISLGLLFDIVFETLHKNNGDYKAIENDKYIDKLLDEICS
jgi:hypothetical protein